MSGSVDADPVVLNGLRQRLLSFNDRQVAGLDQVLADLTRTELEFEDARADAEREVRRAEVALDECRMAQAAAAAEGGYVDCSGPQWALEQAREHLRVVMQAIADVQHAGEAYRGRDREHRSYLASAIPRMRLGLEARAVSLEAYLAWRVDQVDALGRERSGPADALAAIAQDLANKNRYEAIALPMPSERREGNIGGPERQG